MKNIHIGYGDSATGCILEAIKKHGLAGDGAVPSRDDFTQGPISECLAPNGLNQRIAYWESVGRALDSRFEARVFYNGSIKILDDLEADEVTIWIGDSCHDILATGWLISYLEDKNFKWFIVNLTTIAKNDLLQGLPAVNLAMYAPDEITKLYKYRKLLDSDSINYFISIWNKAASENSHYRIKKENKIISVDEDYFDEYILSHIQSQFEPAKKVIGRILGDGEYRISDTTVEWNIKKMIDRNLVKYEGDLSTMISYNIKRNEEI